MKFEEIEITLVSAILILQFFFFARTFWQIQLLRKLVPALGNIKKATLFIEDHLLEKLKPSEILAQKKDFLPKLEIENTQQINILDTSDGSNTIFDKILNSINSYLIRNHKTNTDFNLIKDITIRHTDALEEDISISINVPLYLGLAGTMMGIIIGLFNMPDFSFTANAQQNDTLLNSGISLLIDGVKIAMVASFVGLILTVFNSSLTFKGARSKLETHKNDFFTFIQVEMLPDVNSSMVSTLESLQTNLIGFNHTFESNLNKLGGIFNANAEALKAQKELLDAIDKSKVAEISRFNLKILKQLDISMYQLEKFNHSFSNLNGFVENSQSLIEKSNELLSRTDNFKVIAEKVEERMDQSQVLFDYLTQNFRDLESHKQQVNEKVAEVGFSISGTFKELKEHIEQSSQTLKNFSIDELEILKKVFSESKTNLNHLEYLQTISVVLDEFKKQSHTDVIQIKTDLLEKIIQHEKPIAKSTFKLRISPLLNWFKRQFKVNRKLNQKTSKSQNINHKEKPESLGKTLYFSTPNANGSFSTKNGHFNFIPNESMYKFSLKDTGFAEFSFCENTTSSIKGLKYPEQNIDPVCISDNSYTSEACKILNLKPGIAQLKDDTWIVSQKTHIRYLE